MTIPTRSLPETPATAIRTSTGAPGWISPADRLAGLDEAWRYLLPLIDQAVVSAEASPDLYAMLMRESEAIRAWFASRTGWRVFFKAEYIRLAKEPVVSLPGQGWPGCEAPFDYELAVWTMWYAEGVAGTKFTLSGLARAIQHQAGTDAIGLTRVDWTTRDHRRALRRAVECLQRLRVIEILDGDLQEYVECGGIEVLPSTEALFAKGAAFRAFLVALPEMIVDGLTVAGDPSVLERPRQPDFVDARQRLFRSLLLSPTVLRADDPEAFAVLDEKYAREEIDLECWTMLGWRLEVTQECAMLLRPANDTPPGLTYPGGSGVAHLALVTVGTIRDLVYHEKLVADHAGRVAVSREHFATILVEVQRDPSYQFGKTTTTLRQDELFAKTVGYLVSYGMADVERGTDRVLLSPAFARLEGYYAADGLGMAQDPRLQQLDTVDATADGIAAAFEDNA